ncbi:MAG: thiamine phosphate synthase [Calditerrivibrio sp.]|nr:thiamine phosphate synthase [Calditerrivibrio sp.]MCA1980533.1 thiamine phosphate synthase [Calditerrivibrio sp.]
MKIIFILDYKTYYNSLFEVAYEASNYADTLWFRIKDVDAKIVIELCRKLRRMLPDKELFLSERADIASICEFDGVHLGANSIKPEIIKGKFNRLIVGYSAHSLKEIEEIEADYFTLSPIFWTKKDYKVNPLGPLDVRNIGKKVFALGGIKASNCSRIIGLGYSGIAGISLLEDLPHIKNLFNTTN